MSGETVPSIDAALKIASELEVYLDLLVGYIPTDRFRQSRTGTPPRHRTSISKRTRNKHFTISWTPISGMRRPTRRI